MVTACTRSALAATVVAEPAKQFADIHISRLMVPAEAAICCGIAGCFLPACWLSGLVVSARGAKSALLVLAYYDNPSVYFGSHRPHSPCNSGSSVSAKPFPRLRHRSASFCFRHGFQPSCLESGFIHGLTASAPPLRSSQSA